LILILILVASFSSFFAGMIIFSNTYFPNNLIGTEADTN
jgi:hypothetical protein